MLSGPVELPGNIIRGSTTFCLTRVGDRAYYVPRGCTLEDKLHCWRVKADHETGRIFFVNCGGLGPRWTLPDTLASIDLLNTAGPDGSRHRRSSLPGSSPTAKHAAADAVAAEARSLVELSSGRKKGNSSDTKSFWDLSLPGKSFLCSGKQPLRVHSNGKRVADIYVNDIAYLRSFDEEGKSPASFETALHGEFENARTPLEGRCAETSLLEAQLRRRIEDYAEEVTTLRRRLEDQERLFMEKELALVELEERIVSMRLHMVEAVSAYRQNTYSWQS
ncbi:hypothetical protein TcCL_NonESM05293 [Trypanosoma cruzi]|uniref:Uncharacterized protein n=1 Tax=Trypanosoma cruzi (strain CL Brener) TaxID=353153 RepID=Q4DFD4_TRYCC|nr:hypothetical protein Tc00.1047053507017.104 [Trypanosoma cruzi]EAN91246.1 hypothetical protein Tc00.1047053507017.104 [Trypanosoma cruzi]RNC44963.1 hypothetical protein TcCL_NonESM05293 [Trypanosoma cruzi]|eukprot:XP_813097.1 hypothetical protein [Trypanosoma cruzi strain CL Brener]